MTQMRRFLIDPNCIFAERLDSPQGLEDRGFPPIGNPGVENTAMGKGLTLAGSADAIDIDNILSSLAANTVGTFIVWMITTDITATQEIISFGDTDADTRIQFDIYNNGMLRALAGVTGTTQWALDTDSVVFVNDTLYCMGLVQDGTSPILYVNGIAVAQAFSTDTDKTYWFSQMSGIDNARIGCGNWNNGGNASWFKGTEVINIIYKRALSATEMLNLATGKAF